MARAAMDTYRLASAMVTATDNPSLAAHVATLRRHLARRNGRKKKKRETDQSE